MERMGSEIQQARDQAVQHKYRVYKKKRNGTPNKWSPSSETYVSQTTACNFTVCFHIIMIPIVPYNYKLVRIFKKKIKKSFNENMYDRKLNSNLGFS